MALGGKMEVNISNKAQTIFAKNKKTGEIKPVNLLCAAE